MATKGPQKGNTLTVRVFPGTLARNTLTVRVFPGRAPIKQKCLITALTGLAHQPIEESGERPLQGASPKEAVYKQF